VTDPENTSPRRIGWPVEFDAKSSHAPNTLVAMPIDVPTGTVVGFGAIAKAPGARSSMILYTDRAGAPGALVTFTPPFTLAVGPQTIAAAAPIEVEAGRFWLAGLYDRHASLGIDYSDKSVVVYWVSHAFGSPPDSFPTPGKFMGQRFNWWITIL
jgi:hypothetical protein